MRNDAVSLNGSHSAEAAFARCQRGGLNLLGQSHQELLDVLQISVYLCMPFWGEGHCNLPLDFFFSTLYSDL
jgi:hypothetical protein